MRRINTAMTASTSRMWIKPPNVYDETIPSSQRITRRTAIVPSMEHLQILFVNALPNSARTAIGFTQNESVSLRPVRLYVLFNSRGRGTDPTKSVGLKPRGVLTSTGKTVKTCRTLVDRIGGTTPNQVGCADIFPSVGEIPITAAIVAAFL